MEFQDIPSNKHKVPSAFSNSEQIFLKDVVRIKKSQFEGSMLKSQYIVGKPIDQGSCSNVYKVYDHFNQENKQVPFTPLALKISEDYTGIYNEIQIIQQIHRTIDQYPKKSQDRIRRQFPSITSYGMLALTS